MAIWFGGKIHGVDADASTKWKQVPVCGAKTKATGQITTGAITCVRCLTKLGMPVPDGARPKRVVYASGAFGWTMIERGTYEMQRPGVGGVGYDTWRLEHQPQDPRGGWNHNGWYLWGPDHAEPHGELMYGPDGDSRLNASIDAANRYIDGAYDRAHARAKRLAEKGL